MCKCLGDEEEPSPSIGEVIVLLTGDALFGKASDREAGLVIFFISFFMSYIWPVTSRMKTVLACRTKRW